MAESGIIDSTLTPDTISTDEALKLYLHADLSELVYTANAIRQKLYPGSYVGWIIDRNVNSTNICFSQCDFCNFCVKAGDPGGYVLEPEEYFPKIEEVFEKGGDQLLLQGGMHPRLGLDFYCNLFRKLKNAYPQLKLHALGPPEIVFLAKQEGLDYDVVLKSLVEAGLDSLPGAGAEILSDRVRHLISPAKASADEWLELMRIAHKRGLITSATMMFGHIETPEERVQHLIKIRDLQAEKPPESPGFLAFIPWPFQREGTALIEKYPDIPLVSGAEYLRLIAMARIVLYNVPHIQASLLTVGPEIAQLCLHAGADDLGSVMMEEHVLSVAGSGYRYDAEGMQAIIRDAGFQPKQRNQKYKTI